MATVSIDWTADAIRLAARPNLSRPPILLSEIGLNFPATVSLSTKGQKREWPTQAALDAIVRSSDGQISDEEIGGLASSFNQFIGDINLSQDALVALMGSVTRLIFVLPPGVLAGGVAAFGTLASRITTENYVVAHPAAILAGLGRDRTEAESVVYAVWDEELRVQSHFVYDGELAFAGTRGSLQRLDGSEPRRLIDGAERSLRRMAGRREDGPGGPSRALAAEVMDCILGGVSDDEAMVALVSERLAVPVTQEQVQGLRDELLLAPAHFLLAALTDGANRGRPLVLWGRVFEGAEARRRMAEAAQDAGVMLCEPRAALFGALGMAPPEKAVLPYDCGVMLKLPDSGGAIGSLLLVRSSADQRELSSRVYKMPLTEGQTVEVAFYTRQLDITTRQVRYEVMKTHPFIPAVREGIAEIRASLAMKAPDSPNEPPTVTLRVYDGVKGGDPYTFPDLPVSGGAVWPRRLLRDEAAFSAMQWVGRIAPYAVILASSSVDEWLGALTHRGIVTKEEYTRQMLVALGADDDKASKEWRKLKDESPESLQAILRKRAFGVMHETALKVGGVHCGEWRLSNPQTSVTPSKPKVGDGFFNAVSQDSASMKNGDEALGCAKQIKWAWGLVCLPPGNLNVEWDA